MNESQFAKLLSGYINGTCTQEEIAVINKWYSKYRHNPDFINTLSAEEREFLKDRIFNHILEEVQLTPVEPEAAPSPSKFILHYWWAKLAVAAVLLFFVKYAFMDKRLLPANPSQQVVNEIHTVNRSKHILKQVLPDQSVVWLNPEASLTYPKTFRADSRNVRMTGECFFEVTKNPKRPFIIHTAHLVTKVWGTSFRVTDQKEAAMATVTVVTGKVSVSKSGSLQAKETELAEGEVILLPKDEVIFKKKENTLYTNRQADMADMDRWKRVNLTFENASLSEIVKVLDEKFRVSIRVNDDSMNKIAMTADLTDLNLPEVLEVLKTSLKINYEVNDQLILLKNQL